jgi:hypothetical protein
MSYTEYINEYVNTVNIDEPLYTDDLAQKFADQFGVELKHAKKTVNVYLKRLADKGILVRVKKGIYGRVFENIFGNATKPNLTEIAYQMFMFEGAIAVGYETGPTLLNTLGLSTMLPKDYHIATNHHRYRIDGKANIIVTKPFETVTAENIRYLQFIEAVKAMYKYGADAEDPDALLKHIIRRNKLDSFVLLRYAYMYCNDKELREIVRLTIDVTGDDEIEAA